MTQSDDIAWSSDTAYSDDEAKQETKMYISKQVQQSSTFERSNRAYNEVKMVKFILSCTEIERVWQVHPSILEPQSDLFKKAIEYGCRGESSGSDPCHKLRGLERSAPGTNTFFLTDTKESRFDAFVQGVKPTLGRTFTARELMDILVVANDWGFKELRTFSMKKISAAKVDPMEMIDLCRRTKIPEWLLKPYAELAIRLSPLNRSEIRILGPSAVAAISKARESVLRRRMNLIRSDQPPDWMWSVFWHRTCWRLLSDSWYGVLTKPEYADMEPKPALSQEMDALGGKDISKPLGILDKYSICPFCNTEEKIGKWMNLAEDMQIATKILKEELGDNVDLWLSHSETV